MAWTQDQVTALEQAIAAGRLSVRYEDMSVTYRSLDEMVRLLDKMRRETGITSGDSSRRYPKHNKGLRSE